MADVTSVHAEFQTLCVRPFGPCWSVALGDILFRRSVVFQACGSRIAVVVIKSKVMLAIEQSLRHDKHFQDESGADKNRADPEQPAVSQRSGDITAGNAGDKWTGGETHGVRNHSPTALMVEEDVTCNFRSESVDRPTGETLHRSGREQR